MKIKIQQQVYVENKLNTFRTVYRDFESTFFPRKGDFYEDSAFKNRYEYEVIQVIFNFQQDTCVINIAPEILPTSCNQKDVIEHVKAMMLHGWKCNVL